MDQVNQAFEQARATGQIDPSKAPEPMLQFFAWEHLPAGSKAQATSHKFFELAHTLVATLPRNPERTVALRKLLEAKDAAVRTNFYK